MTRAFTPSRRRLASLRLAALSMSQHAPRDPSAVVRELLAVQAQDYEGALWAVGLRATASRAVVESAHRAAEFVRSWPLRGTLHFVAGEDLGWLLELTAERTLRAASRRHQQLGLNAHILDRAAEVCFEALGDGRTAGRRALFAAFAAADIPTAGQRGADILLSLALRGLILLRGKDSWALTQDSITHSRALSHDEALRELAVRYFRSHGPATVHDLAWWSSLTLTDARHAAASARDELEMLNLDGAEYLMRTGLEPAPQGAWLLPGFDEYLLGYADRSAPLAGAGTELIAPSSNGQFRSTVVVDGEVVGLWRRSSTPASTDLDVKPFSPVSSPAMARIAGAVRDYKAFLGRTA